MGFGRRSEVGRYAGRVIAAFPRVAHCGFYIETFTRFSNALWGYQNEMKKDKSGLRGDTCLFDVFIG